MNKKTIITILLVSVCSAIYAQNTGTGAVLLNRLKALQGQGVLFGHQDDGVYGSTWKFEHGRSDVLEICGDFPAVMGFDLGRIELASNKNSEGVPFNILRREIVAQHERGGIVTLSWHPCNPATGKNHRDLTGNPVKNVLKKRGDVRRTFDQWLDRLADFLFSLKDSNGRLVPVIFRPWHEMTGDWFWWGTKSCTPDQYKQLFVYTYRYLKAKGLDNIVWCYSPGSSSKETEQRFMAYYPGDAYVDVIGVDIYDTTKRKDFIGDVQRELRIMSKVAREHNKLFALTETGYKSNPEKDWYTDKLLPAISEYQPLYVLLWRNDWNMKSEVYGPAPDRKQASDFRKFHQNPLTLFVKDIRQKRQTAVPATSQPTPNVPATQPVEEINLNNLIHK